MAGRTYAGATADERVAKRRARLLEAAIDLLGEEGPAGLGVRAVTAAAGLSPRYFYESFSGRDDLLGEVYDALAARLESAIVGALRDPAGPPDVAGRVRRGLESGLELVEGDPRVGRILFVDAHAERTLRDRRAATIDRFTAVLAGEARALWGRADEGAAGTLRARIVVGGYAEAIAWWLADPARASRDEVLDATVDVFVRATGPEPAR